MVEMVLSFGKEAWDKLPDVDQKLVRVAEMAIERARTAAAEEVEKTKAAARQAKETSDALVKKGQQMLSNKAASKAPIDAEMAEGANDDARSMVSGGAESVRSMVTNESVRSVVSSVTNGSERSMVSDDLQEAVQTFGKIRTAADKVAMKDAINLQKVQYGKAGVTMSLSDANNATECNHGCWVFPENFIIDIRGGSTVWLRPVSSVWENGSPWWTLEQVANPKAPREMWNALQMVWGMEAFKMENDGSLVHPEEVLKRAKKELAKQKVDTSAPAGESMSRPLPKKGPKKTFTGFFFMPGPERGQQGASIAPTDGLWE